MKRPLPALALLTMLAACKAQQSPPAPQALSVTDAVVRLAPVEGRPAAGYFTLHGGKAPDRLESVSSPKAATIELHESKMQGGMMSMTPLTGIDVPAGGEVAFKSGGNHAMLFGVDPAVKPGGTIPLRLTFQSGATLDTEAKTIATGDDMPMDSMNMMTMEHEGR
jgi:copper(I)-binding protein